MSLPDRQPVAADDPVPDPAGPSPAGTFSRRSLVADLAAEVWAMEPRRLEAFIRTAAQLPLPQDKPQGARPSERPSLRIFGRTAIIEIKGVLMRDVPWWFAYFGIEGTSYIALRDLLVQAAASGDVEAIRLQVNSPGGAVGGITEVVDALFAAREQKTLTASVEELDASAAYWLSSIAQTITAEPNAQVGSIGVYTVMTDWSEAAAKEGVKVHVIRSGEYKGAGVMGAPITEKQLANLQEVIDGIAANFRADVADGRGLLAEKVETLATGEIWLAGRAKELGLIDAVTKRNSQSAQTSKGMIMNTDKNIATDADPETLRAEGQKTGIELERQRLANFKAAFPGDLEFALNAYETGLSLEQAKGQHELLSKRIAASAKPAVAAMPAGAAPVPYHDSAPAGTDVATTKDFLDLVRTYAREHKCSYREATRAVHQQHLEIHEKFLREAEGRPTPIQGRCERVSV